MIATGTAIAYWCVLLLLRPSLFAHVPCRVDFGLSFVKTSINWRLPIALQVIFAVGLLAGVHFLPECAFLSPPLPRRS